MSSAPCRWKRILWYGSALSLLISSLVAGLVFYRQPPTSRLQKIYKNTDHLRLVYTARTNGFLQSCGCSANQIGGIARQVTLLGQLRETERDVVLLDTGNLAEDLERAEAVLECFMIASYDALGLGQLELKLGKEFIHRAESRGLVLTSFSKAGTAGNNVVPFLLLNPGPTGILVVSVPPQDTEIRGSDVERLLSGLDRGKFRLVILSTPLGEVANGMLGELVSQFASCVIVIGTQAAVSETFRKGRIFFVPEPTKAMVGIIDIDFGSAPVPTFSHSFAAVRQSLVPDKRAEAVVSGYYQRQAEQLVEASLQSDFDWRYLQYEPATECRTCHTAAVRAWQNSKHSRATQTLREKDRLVPECLSCHSELFRRNNLFNRNLEVAWNGVDCATCHGDAVLHTALGQKGGIARKVTEATCRGCHDSVNDPKFDYKTYLEKIRHW